MSEFKLSIIVATRDEELNIEECLRRVFKVYPEDCEVLVIDGGSDRTGEIVQRMCGEFPSLRYIRNENDRGKGHAIRIGIQEAKADLMAQFDADLQFLPEELPHVLEPILSGRADVTLGSRFAKESSRLAGSCPFWRKMGNYFVSAYASLLFWNRMTDVTAGMKAWTRDAARLFNIQSDNFSYEVEIPAKALRKGLRVVDVPVTTDARKGGVTKANVVFDGIALLWDTSMYFLGLK